MSPTESTDTPPWETETTTRLKANVEALHESLDDSMGSDFKVFKAANQAERSARLDKAMWFDDGGWTKHTLWHWQRRDVGGILDFWPSRWKAQFIGQMYYGEGNVRKLFKRLRIDIGPSEG